MIEAIAELFVERVSREQAMPALRRASSLLVVDACGRPRRIAELMRIVESSSPVKTSFVELKSVEGLGGAASFDLVWLFVDSESDLSYCGLYLRELGDRFRESRVELVGVGDVDETECALVLSESMVGAAPPWRRGREFARGAALLADRILT
jgi:hypothetical protein